jgi:penicillin-binding protein A
VNARRFLALLLLFAAGCERPGPDAEAVQRLAALRKAAAPRGNNPVALDRDGRPIAGAEFAPFLESLRGRGSATIETTLDPVVQRAAFEALGSYRGALVAIDPRTNEILALASSGGGEIALGGQYEPGSIVKVLTGLNAIESGANVASMFPYHCNGVLKIDGRNFGDWLKSGHGTLNSMDEALAVSCNVFFADLGVRLGRERLHKFMTRAGFDGMADLGYTHASLGRTVGDYYNNFEIAYFAIGLEHESINALHVAMLASMMANRGVMTTPRLMRLRRSVLGYVVAGPPPQGKTTIASRASADAMIRAMQAVAAPPRGTGRHATVDGVSLALKTGTAGDKQRGLEALIMAFAPVESPKIAFGIIAVDAGPAEYAGAKIAHDFVEKLKPRL